MDDKSLRWMILVVLCGAAAVFYLKGENRAAVMSLALAAILIGSSMKKPPKD